MEELIVICAWCRVVKNVETKKPIYLVKEAENYLSNITHGICKDCTEKVFQKNKKDLL